MQQKCVLPLNRLDSDTFGRENFLLSNKDCLSAVEEKPTSRLDVSQNKFISWVLREFRWISVNINSKFIFVFPYFSCGWIHSTHLFAYLTQPFFPLSFCTVFVSLCVWLQRRHFFCANFIAIRFSHLSVVSFKTWLCGATSDGFTETAYAAQCGALRRGRSPVQQFWYPQI